MLIQLSKLKRQYVCKVNVQSTLFKLNFFSGILQNNISLRSLNLSKNSFSIEGGKILGTAISNNDTLETFDLSWNSIRLDGAQAFAKGIAVSSFYILGIIETLPEKLIHKLDIASRVCVYFQLQLSPLITDMLLSVCFVNLSCKGSYDIVLKQQTFNS